MYLVKCIPYAAIFIRPATTFIITCFTRIIFSHMTVCLWNVYYDSSNTNTRRKSTLSICCLWKTVFIQSPVRPCVGLKLIEKGLMIILKHGVQCGCEFPVFYILLVIVICVWLMTKMFFWTKSGCHIDYYKIMISCKNIDSVF